MFLTVTDTDSLHKGGDYFTPIFTQNVLVHPKEALTAADLKVCSTVDKLLLEEIELLEEGN